MGQLDGMQVVLVVARQGYREEELEAPRAALEREGATVRLASSSLGPASGMRDGECYPDVLYCALDLDETDGLVFVGGYGASEYFPDVTAHKLAREAVSQGKVVGAICYASSTLANAGLLEGKEATGFPTRASHLRSCGVRYSDVPVVVTGRIVTGRGPEDAQAFAEALVQVLKS